MALYKNSVGKWRTQSLFIELNYGYSAEPAVFALGAEDVIKDGVTYPSLYKMYMEVEDPTEYDIAQKALGSYEHWQILCASKCFKDEITKWRDEKEVRAKSKWLNEIKKMAEEGTPRGFAAAKFLANQEWKHHKGRPSKKEIDKHLKKETAHLEAMEEDYSRILSKH